MNVSDLFIANLALAHLGKSDIKSFEEKSVAAINMKLTYEACRLEALNSAPWGFATLWKAGVAVDIDPMPGWSYVFTYPVDALRVWEIARTSKEEKEVPFRVTARPDDLTKKIIQTLVPTPIFVYTVDITNPNLFDWDYITALSWLLAFKNAMAITKSRDLQEKAQRNWLAFSSVARARTANENVPDSDITASYQSVR